MATALSDAYATVEEYRARVHGESSDDDVATERELTAVSRYIDSGHVAKRKWGFSRDPAQSDPSLLLSEIFDSPSRLYAPARRVLDIGDWVSVHGIAIDIARSGVFSQSLAASDFELLPRGAAQLPEAWPYEQVELTPWGGIYVWPALCRVQVTGVRGWPAIPAAIVTATIELTAILRVESPRATNRVNEMNQVLSTSRVAQGIVADLARTYRMAPVFV